MKLVANIKLKPTPQQAQSLRDTLERCNAACNWLSDIAWAKKTFGQFALQREAYGNCRSQFGLTAQAAVRCIAKVADAYKLDKDTKRQFRKHAAQPYDDRIFRFCALDHVSIWTVAGRMKIPYVCGERQRKLLVFRKGEVDLMFVGGQWYLACVCDVPEPDTIGVKDVLGIDLGMVNLAVDNHGETHGGAAVDEARRRYSHRRRNLQRNGSRATRRKLKRISGKQARFQAITNHRISKTIVAKAQTLHAAIALEDLSGIRGRVQAGRRHRARLNNWGFYQLRQFITYKAALAGVPVMLVDPRYTSQCCPSCGTIDRKNRPSRDSFHCISCGHGGAADTIAAINIRYRALTARASVNVPEACKRRVDDRNVHSVLSQSKAA